MAASDDFDSAADRLEAALERILSAIQRPTPVASNNGMTELAAIARQLDALITMVSEALAGTPEPRVTEADQGQG